MPELENLRIESGMDKYKAIGMSSTGFYPPKFFKDILEHEELSKKLNHPLLDYDNMRKWFKYDFVAVIIFMVALYVL